MDQYADTAEIDSISQKENTPRLKQTRRHKHKHGMQNSVAVTRQGKPSDGLQTEQQAADAVITIRPLLTFLQGDVCMSENLTGILMVSGSEGFF